MKYISSPDAADMLGCSVRFIHTLVKRGILEHRYESRGTRQMLRLSLASVKAYIPIAEANPRIGRELFCREVQRNSYKSNGYMMEYHPEHHRANRDGYVPQHVIVMEEHINRPLEKQEEVHHINKVRDDNAIENLVLFGSKAEHLKFHGRLRAAFVKANSDSMLEEAIIRMVEKWTGETL